MSDVIIANVSSDALSKKEEWTAKRDDLLENAALVTQVESDDELEMSGAMQTAISKHIKALGAERLAVTRPLDDVKRAIMADEKSLRKLLETELGRIKGMNNHYATRVAAEIEQKRIEAARLAEQQRLEEAERQMSATQAFGEAAELPEPEPEPVAAPIPVQPRTSANRMVKRWSFVVEDGNAVPREFCTVDPSKIRAHIKYAASMGNDPLIAGVKFNATMNVEGR